MIELAKQRELFQNWLERTYPCAGHNDDLFDVEDEDQDGDVFYANLATQVQWCAWKEGFRTGRWEGLPMKVGDILTIKASHPHGPCKARVIAVEAITAIETAARCVHHGPHRCFDGCDTEFYVFADQIRKGGISRG